MNETGRVTRKGRRLLARKTATGEAPTFNESGNIRVGAIHDPNRPFGFNLIERMANHRALQQERDRRIQERQRQEQQTTDRVLITASDIPRPHHQHGREQPSSQSVVVAEVILDPNHHQQERHGTGNDSNVEASNGPDIERERRKTWIYTANIVIVFVVALVLVIVLPIKLQNGSPSGPPLTRPPTPVAPLPPPSPKRTRLPLPIPTFPPSLSPRGAPFVPFGPEIMGANEFAELGSDVAFVGDRWFAYGSQGHGVNRSGLVHVVDMYNGTQIGQDIEGNTTEGFAEVGWELASAEGGWLAVAGRHTVRVLRYNHTTSLWEQYGRILTSTDLQVSHVFDFDSWYVQSISVNPFLSDNSTISLVVTTYPIFLCYSYIDTFVIDIDYPSSDWRRLGDTLFFLGECVYASLVAGPSLMIWDYRTWSSVRIFALNRLGWGLSLVKEEFGLAQVDAVAVVPHSNGSLTMAYLADNFIQIVEIDINANVTDKGLPIRSVGTRDDRLALYGDWLVHATRTVVRVFHYDDSNGWTRQGEDIELERGGFYVAPALGGDPESPTLAVGLPGKSVLRYESVYLNSTNLTSFTNEANVFTNETGHVFENLRVYGYEGAVQLYNREM